METIRFANPMVAAQSVATAMSSKQNRFTPRPWNQYMPEDSLWWVVPSTEWPAFRHGKYVFIKDKGVMEVGLNVEKGFGLVTQTVGTKLGSSSQIIEPDWRWHTFVQDLVSGAFDDAMASVHAKARSPLYVRIGISFPSSREHFDPVSAVPTHRLTFSWEAGKLQLVSRQDPYEDYAVLNSINNFADLARELTGVKSQNWYWIDFYAYVTLALPREDAKHDGLVDAYDLISIMEPWERWLGVL